MGCHWGERQGTAATNTLLLQHSSSLELLSVEVRNEERKTKNEIMGDPEGHATRQWNQWMRLGDENGG
jgi:hypothetical protein